MSSTTVALITGARRGIGRKIAEQFLAAGTNVVATCTNAAQAEQLQKDLSEVGRAEVLGVGLDVCDPGQVVQLARLIEARFAKLDILINNAGVMDKSPSSVATQSLVDWDHIVNTNLRGPFLVCQAMIPLLKKSKNGRIINLAGMLGTFASGMEGGGFPAYRISKAGLNALTLIMAEELNADGIIVNAVDPGWVRTDLGGPDAPRNADEAAADVVSVARPNGDKPRSGVLLRGGQPVPW